jgi:hypothetical protein
VASYQSGQPLAGRARHRITPITGSRGRRLRDAQYDSITECRIPRPVPAEPLACITQPALVAVGILRPPGQELIRAGDLLVATEASARTIVVRCASSCTARYIAAGPAITHAEGHIAFTSAGH